jgi:2'-5' RNA ligase
MTRTFVAVELEDPARAYLAREIGRLGRALPRVRWVDPAGIHLTLAFLGELDDARLAAVEAAAEIAARAAHPFTLEVAGLGTFGPPTAPTVVWAGVGGNLPRLGALRETLTVALEVRGFARDARPFSPHLTLARLRDPLAPDDAARLRQLVAAAGVRAPVLTPDALIPVDQISIMQSEQLRPLSRYTRLRAVGLGGGSEQ